MSFNRLLSACDNTYGPDCKFTCHCPPNDNCSAINGLCSGGKCEDGWSGSGCQNRKLMIRHVTSKRCLRKNELGWQKSISVDASTLSHTIVNINFQKLIFIRTPEKTCLSFCRTQLFCYAKAFLETDPVNTDSTSQQNFRKVHSRPA